MSVSKTLVETYVPSTSGPMITSVTRSRPHSSLHRNSHLRLVAFVYPILLFPEYSFGLLTGFFIFLWVLATGVSLVPPLEILLFSPIAVGDALWSPIVSYLLVRKLDGVTSRDYLKRLPQNDDSVVFTPSPLDSLLTLGSTPLLFTPGPTARIDTFVRPASTPRPPPTVPKQNKVEVVLSGLIKKLHRLPLLEEVPQHVDGHK